MSIKNTPPTEVQIEEMQNFYDENDVTIDEVGQKFGWNRHTLSKYIRVKNRKLSDKDRKRNKSNAVSSWRKRTKVRLVEYKGGKCYKCGYNRCLDALEFHHEDPRKKELTISGSSKSFDKLKAEADKCYLLCSNCHRELHALYRMGPKMYIDTMRGIKQLQESADKFPAEFKQLEHQFRLMEENLREFSNLGK